MQKLPENPHIVIVGAGFGGLACAQALGGKSVNVTIVDRRNYHLFVPLLYQVATAALSPADIARPIRRILGRYKNIDVVLGTVTGIDTTARSVRLANGAELPYDKLVVATGSDYSYFGHPEWAEFAPGPRSLENARLHPRAPPHRLRTRRGVARPDPAKHADDDGDRRRRADRRGNGGFRRRAGAATRWRAIFAPSIRAAPRSS